MTSSAGHWALVALSLAGFVVFALVLVNHLHRGPHLDAWLAIIGATLLCIAALLRYE